MQTPPRALRRDPMLWFTIIGLMLFAVDWTFSAPDTPTLSDEMSLALDRDFERLQGRAPTEAEQRGLQQRWLQEEALYREGIALGLDRGDPVVRRRIVQKMQQLQTAEDPTWTPDEAILLDYLTRHPERYQVAGTATFEQRFASTDRHVDPQAEARRWALLLASDDPAATHVGDAFALSHQGAQSTTQIERRYGAKMAAAIGEAALDEWTVAQSAYGWHVIRVSARTEARLPAVDEVRERVIKDWRAEQGQVVP